MDLELNKIEPELHPRLRLFLSADIVGSTALKQPLDLDHPPTAANDPSWADIIKVFYDGISSELESSCLRLLAEIADAHSSKVDDNYKEYLGAFPVFWKTIGDEVIFIKDLQSDFHTLFTLIAWLDAVNVVRLSLRDLGSSRGASLDLKCTAWVAGFPVRNIALSAPRSGYSLADETLLSDQGIPPTTGDVDFVGPSMDIGFRIAQWSTSSKFYISVDLAFLIAGARSDTRNSRELTRFFGGEKGRRLCNRLNDLTINFERSDFLKGVSGGLQYPRLWIKNHFPGSFDELADDIGPKSYTELSNLADALEFF